MWFILVVSRLKEKLGYEPSDKELASSLMIPFAEVRLKLIACSLAREKLAMSNFRLVMSIAKKYDNLGAELPDLVQVGSQFTEGNNSLIEAS